MLVYRVEHHETSAGPFQSEFYLQDTYNNVAPHHWGDYIPVFDDCYDSHYDFASGMRRWGCHNKSDIQMMDADEGEVLAENGWIVRVYKIPDHCVFIADSTKQVIFDFAMAVVVMTLDLIEFLLGKEVEYVE